MATGRLLASGPQLSQAREKELQERDGGCAGEASNRGKDAAEESCHFLLPDLEKLRDWGRGVGVWCGGHRRDFRDRRKTGYQYANVTSKRKGSHFSIKAEPYTTQGNEL